MKTPQTLSVSLSQKIQNMMEYMLSVEFGAKMQRAYVQIKMDIGLHLPKIGDIRVQFPGEMLKERVEIF